MAMIAPLLFMLFGVSLAATFNCNAKTFEDCQKKFTDDLKIDASYNWKNPAALGVQLQNIYINGVTGSTDKGIVSVCTAYNLMLDCLNTNSFTAASCFDPQFLIQADTDPITAYQYSGQMSMVQYQCGSGFYPAVENWDCLQKVYKSQNSTIQGCFRTFQNNIINDGINSCKYAADGSTCFRNTAKSCSSSVQYYACESFRQYTAVLYQPICKNQCTV